MTLRLYAYWLFAYRMTLTCRRRTIGCERVYFMFLFLFLFYLNKKDVAILHMLDVWALCLMYLLLIANNNNHYCISLSLNIQLRIIYISYSALFPLNIIYFSLSPQKIAWFVCFLNEFVSKQAHSKREKRKKLYDFLNLWRLTLIEEEQFEQK